MAVTVGWGTVDTPPPANFDQDTTFQGGTAMGFYNMANGDLPYMKSLADQYALSDNYHQFMFGGTGPNSITTGTAAPLIYSDANGNPATPPADQVENPNAYNDKGYYPNQQQLVLERWLLDRQHRQCQQWLLFQLRRHNPAGCCRHYELPEFAAL